jgi:hypothetical protein
MRLGSSESGPVREGEGGKTESIFDLELGKYRGQVVPHRGLSNPELLRNFLILQTATNQRNELTLPLGKLLDTLLCVGCGQRTFAVESGGFPGRGRQVFAGS